MLSGNVTVPMPVPPEIFIIALVIMVAIIFFKVIEWLAHHGKLLMLLWWVSFFLGVLFAIIKVIGAISNFFGDNPCTDPAITGVARAIMGCP